MIVGAEVHESDDSEHAVHLVRRTALAEGIAAMDIKPALHGENGSTLKAATVLAMLNWLGIKPSYSRPRVSDDNAFAESLFRTAKYRPEFPAQGFETLDGARAWAAEFVRWYSVVEQRHTGQDQAILAARHTLYRQARQRHLARWWGGHSRLVAHRRHDPQSRTRRGGQVGRLRSTYSAQSCVTQATTTLTRADPHELATMQPLILFNVQISNLSEVGLFGHAGEEICYVRSGIGSPTRKVNLPKLCRPAPAYYSTAVFHTPTCQATSPAPKCSS